MNVGAGRRRALLLLPLVLPLGMTTGCASATAETTATSGPTSSGPTSSGPTSFGPLPTVVASITVPATSDDAAALSAQRLTVDLQAMVGRVTHRVPALATRVAALASVHRAQDALFAPLAPLTPSLAQVPRDKGAALALLTRQETAAVASLLGLAGQVEDGTLAAHLAAMAAGISQPLSTLTRSATVVPTAPLTPGPDTVAAWQHTLAAEHWAIFEYGSFGARAPHVAQPLYQAAVDAHVARRDALEAALTSAGVEPVAAAPAYPLEVSASRIEPRMAQTYAALVAGSPVGQRGFGLAALADAAERGLQFGASAEPLPGIAAAR